MDSACVQATPAGTDSDAYGHTYRVVVVVIVVDVGIQQNKCYLFSSIAKEG